MVIWEREMMGLRKELGEEVEGEKTGMKITNYLKGIGY